ncbi:DNRLRE domain-containing protein [Streptomyces sp. NPDC051452]|uniref:DNRLRE domain-containing protein n=1 Tax=Streptomyces sp. NPDC051452 TaxID=3365654 RepID=UPI0037A4659B
MKVAPKHGGDEASALRAAARQKHRVEVVADRTETTTTWANANGTLTMEQHAGPVRYRSGSGWTDVDASLVRAADGTVRAKAHPLGLRLAGKSDGPAPLITLGSGKQSVTLGWDGTLPKPAIRENVATYPDALPHADIVVESTRTGVEQSLVLKDRTAAADGTFTMPLRAPGLTARATLDGGVSFVDNKTGLPAGLIPAPTMWDARVDDRSGEHLHRAPVKVKVEQKGSGVALRFSADPAFLKDPDTVYPVTVDPALKLADVFDTFVQQGYGTDQSAATELKLGNNGSSQVARSFLHFPEQPYEGKHILSAALNLYETHSWSCTARSWEVWDTAQASTSSRWTNQPKWNKKWASSTATKGYSSACAAGYDSVDITSLVQAWSDNGHVSDALGIRATDESDPYGWKRFNSSEAVSNDPYLSVTYNTRPAAPAALTAAPGGGTGTSAYVTTTTPTLSYLTSDADKNTLTPSWEIAEGTTTVLSSTGAKVSAGAAASLQVPSGKLVNGHTYKFRGQTGDGTDTSDWSAWTSFTVDVSKAPPARADAPQSLQTGATQTLTPILSGMITAASGGQVTTDFVLKDSSGAVVGNNPLVTTSAESGKRAAAQVPDGLLTDGASYTWQMRACTEGGCSAYSAPVSFTVKLPAAPAAPTTSTITIGRDAFTDMSVSDAPVQDATLKVGADGTAHWRSYLKADLSAIPAGARVTSAALRLTAAGCLGACESHGLELHPMNDDWSNSATAADLQTSESANAYVTGPADPAALDVTDVVEGWLENPESNHGVALRADDESSPTTTGVSYHSSRDTGPAADGPQLTVTYTSATAPGTPTQARAVAGDGGLLVSWNPPEDTGYNGSDLSYTVTVKDSGVTQVAQQQTQDSQVVVTGLPNGAPYTVEVTATNDYGTGRAALSPVVTTAAVANGTTAYQQIAQEYLDARNGLISGRYTSADAAVAASAHGPGFTALLHSQEPGLLDQHTTDAGHGITYTTLTAALQTPLAAGNGTNAVVLHAVHTGTTVTHDGSGDSEPLAELTNDAFVFDNSSGKPVLTQQLDDKDLQTYLPPTAGAATYVTADDPDSTVMDDAADASPTASDGDGYAVAQPSTITPMRTSVSRSGAADWAYRHRNDKDEFGEDCTNFVSKALNRGGGMGMNSGWYRSDYNWWRNYLNQTYSWAAANHFFHFLNLEHSASWRSYDNQATPGDVVFFDYNKKSKDPISHAAMVVKNSGGKVYIAQHSSPHRYDTLAAARSRHHGATVWIAHISPTW